MSVPKLALTPHQIRAVAVEARCYPTTVQRWLRGDTVASTSDERITEALRALGLLDAKEAT